MPDPATPKRSAWTTVAAARKAVLRSACLVLVGTAPLIGCTGLVGCAGLGSFRLRQPNHLAAVPRPRFSEDPQLEEVVDHLNRNVDKLHSWQAHKVQIRANNMPGLSGSLVVEEGQHLRMLVNSLAGHEVDMGSNNDVFWIWAKRMEPSYVFCRHEQIDVARQSLGIPFEPQWLMQALGVAPIETEGLTMQIDPTGQRARLVQPLLTAHGQPLQKVMVVDLVHGVITEHCIQDSRGQKIAVARLDDFRRDKASGAVLPHRVKLDWPQNQMSLVMNMGEVEINPTSIPSQIWDMPTMRGTQVVDLGRTSDPGVSRVAGNIDEFQSRRSDTPYTEPAEDLTADDESGRARLTFDDSEDPAEVPIKRAIRDSEPIKHSTAPSKREWFEE
ncbi:MAG: hypothetical protein JWP89_6019 [Schlesneria sp.]|nr:hypothetical protein [Schlesneria sp.]